MRWYADGAGWNGRGSKWAIANDGGVAELFQTDMKLTNNEAEYEALEEVLRRAADGDQVFADSEVIVKQVKGEYRVRKKHLVEPSRRCMAIMAAKPHLLLTWVKTGRNEAGKIIDAAKGGRTEMTGGKRHVVYSS